MKLLSSIKVATLGITALAFSVLPTIAQDVPNFPDIEDNFYKTEIEEAVGMGIVEGYPDGTFGPDKQVTREEAAVMIFKAIKNVAPDVDVNNRPANRAVRPFKDIADDRWSAKEINWIQWNLFPANVAQLTGNFRPEDPITRLELVEFLRRTGELVSLKLSGSPELTETEEPIEFSDVVGYDKVLTSQMSAFCRVAAPLDEGGDAFAPQQQANRDYTAAAIVRAVGCESN